MGLFDGLKQSVEDAKAELEAKAKEVQDKLNPVAVYYTPIQLHPAVDSPGSV